MLERQLQYTFRDPGLAREACTHCSFPDPSCPSYQRLEFLGDAVIDLGISRFFDRNYRCASLRVVIYDCMQRHGLLPTARSRRGRTGNDCG